MMNISKAAHTFHIPVMGIGYTIDSPIKIAHFGIDSVISIIDHSITEQMREYHCHLNELPFIPIPEDDDDCRAKRITSYLNLMKTLVDRNFKRIKRESFEPGSDLTKYFELLPETSALKAEYKAMLQSNPESMQSKQEALKDKMVPGEIHVNIMTKLDGATYTKNYEALPVEYNHAHAALRGFANSNLDTSMVLSAGLNPRLFAYMANFEDFFPDENGKLKKKIILKVSDYRSAIVQGKMLAKKGLWVSEFRVESGLNCGGHAFATEGYLLGPILHEFKENKAQLIDELFELYTDALRSLEKETPKVPHKIDITAQGGVGTHDEHQFLLDHFEVDSVGWGSPFLLVPEAVNIDDDSMNLIAKADENDFYLSNISPLGILFNSVKGTSGEIEKQKRTESGKPGAPCVKKYLTFNTEFSNKAICTASSQYQKLKISELESKNLGSSAYNEEINKITDKVCLCVSLCNSTLLKNEIKMPAGIQGVSICPGPNMAYFNKSVSLKTMVDHIYGRTNIISRSDRPNMFIQELKMYINYLKEKVEESLGQPTKAQIKYYQLFQENLTSGINYYLQLFASSASKTRVVSEKILNDLLVYQEELQSIKIPALQTVAV